MNKIRKIPGIGEGARPRQGPGVMSFSVGNAFLESGAELYLGIDPGLNRTGYALIRRMPHGPVVEEGGVIRSTKAGSLADRVLEIGAGVAEVLDEFRPDALAIEKVFHHGQNPKTAVLLAHAGCNLVRGSSARGVRRPLHAGTDQAATDRQRPRRQGTGPVGHSARTASGEPPRAQ